MEQNKSDHSNVVERKCNFLKKQFILLAFYFIFQNCFPFFLFFGLESKHNSSTAYNYTRRLCWLTLLPLRRCLFLCFQKQSFRASKWKIKYLLFLYRLTITISHIDKKLYVGKWETHYSMKSIINYFICQLKNTSITGRAIKMCFSYT